MLVRLSNYSIILRSKENFIEKKNRKGNRNKNVYKKEKMYQFWWKANPPPSKILRDSNTICVCTISMHAMYRMIYYYRNSQKKEEKEEPKSKWKITKNQQGNLNFSFFSLFILRSVKSHAIKGIEFSFQGCLCLKHEIRSIAFIRCDFLCLCLCKHLRNLIRIRVIFGYAIPATTWNLIFTKY